MNAYHIGKTYHAAMKPELLDIDQLQADAVSYGRSGGASKFIMLWLKLLKHKLKMLMSLLHQNIQMKRLHKRMTNQLNAIARGHGV